MNKREKSTACGADQAAPVKYTITHVVNYAEQAAVDALPQFGFHDHTGALYKVEHQKNFIGLLSSAGFVWTAGEANPHLAAIHFLVRLDHPKYVARAFHHDTLLISEEKCIYQMDLSTNRFFPLIEKEKAGIVDIGNCVYDHQDTIWVNDIRGYRIFHFQYDGTLIEVIGNGESGFKGIPCLLNRPVFIGCMICALVRMEACTCWTAGTSRCVKLISRPEPYPPSAGME